jgi:hypothetical protein
MRVTNVAALSLRRDHLLGQSASAWTARVRWPMKHLPEERSGIYEGPVVKHLGDSSGIMHRKRSKVLEAKVIDMVIVTLSHAANT